MTAQRDHLAPSPEVLHLPTIFRRIQNGEIRVPAFQRRFVWREAEVLKLFESVYRGYPIGSILLWRVNEQILKIEQSKQTPFPQVPEQYPINFILDGVQRLSTLFGAFHPSEEGQWEDFDVLFDLEDEEFVLYDEDEIPEAFIRLADLFAPKQLLKAQRELGELDNGDELIEKSIALHAAFQEYMLPVVTITRRDVSEVVEIFERVNSSGLNLNAVDFMRAVTWSEDFDLARALERLEKRLAKMGFNLHQEALVKALAVVMKEEPTPKEMIKLRKRSAKALHRGVELTTDALLKTIDFLRTNLGILSSEFVPYEAQLLVLVSIFAQEIPLPDEVLREMRAWYWSVSFSEAFRGKPDHYVTRAIQSAVRLANGELKSLEHRLSFSVDDAMERRLTQGTALASAFTALFAENKVRSLATGEVIEPEIFMQGFSPEHYEPILPKEHVRNFVDSKATSARVLANTVIVTEADRKLIKQRPLEEILRDTADRLSKQDKAVLKSQFVSIDAVRSLAEGDYAGFLRKRAESIYEHAVKLSSA